MKIKTNTEFINWQINNKIFLSKVINIILVNLKNKNILIKNVNNFKKELIIYIFNSIH